jgi:hypothetical protein
MSLVKGIFYTEDDVGIIAIDDTTWSVTQAYAQMTPEAVLKAEAITTLGTDVLIDEECFFETDENGLVYVCIGNHLE